MFRWLGATRTIFVGLMAGLLGKQWVGSPLENFGSIDSQLQLGLLPRQKQKKKVWRISHSASELRYIQP
jgi:hypothetical protein